MGTGDSLQDEEKDENEDEDEADDGDEDQADAGMVHELVFCCILYVVMNLEVNLVICENVLNLSICMLKLFVVVCYGRIEVLCIML